MTPIKIARSINSIRIVKIVKNLFTKHPELLFLQDVINHSRIDIFINFIKYEKEKYNLENDELINKLFVFENLLYEYESDPEILGYIEDDGVAGLLHHNKSIANTIKTLEIWSDADKSCGRFNPFIIPEKGLRRLYLDELISKKCIFYV